MVTRILSVVAAACLTATVQVPGATAQVIAQPAGGQPSGAAAQQTDQRLARIEAALRDLQGVVYSVENPGVSPRVPVVAGSPNSAVPGQSVAVSSVPESELSVRLTTLEQSLATLTGEVERLAYKLDQQSRALDSINAVGGPEFGAPAALPLPDGAGAGNLPADGAPVDLSSGNTAAEAVTLPDDPEAAYEVAYNAVLAADYDAAEDRLAAFVAKFPDSPQTPEAKFLLGEVYLAVGANGDAARIFLDHVGAYKEDPRAPEAYLKLGIAFSRLDRREEACRVFTAGRNKFSSMPETLRRRYEAEQSGAGC